MSFHLENTRRWPRRTSWHLRSCYQDASRKSGKECLYGSISGYIVGIDILLRQSWMGRNKSLESLGNGRECLLNSQLRIYSKVSKICHVLGLYHFCIDVWNTNYIYGNVHDSSPEKNVVSPFKLGVFVFPAHAHVVHASCIHAWLPYQEPYLLHRAPVPIGFGASWRELWGAIDVA